VVRGGKLQSGLVEDSLPAGEVHVIHLALHLVAFGLQLVSRTWIVDSFDRSNVS
jgi:hypothetical protein